VFIGEAPGATEDRLRKPFCGNSGQVLGELLDTVGLSRDDVWITNCVKYRTDERNRDPSKEERAASRPYLVKELAILGCRYLVTLGKQPLLSMMSSRHMGVPKRGEWASLRIGGQPHWLLPLYHPAVAVYQRSKLPLLKREFQKVLERP
jgi:DNA polymerase